MEEADCTSPGECAHEENITDLSTGDRVCTGCGLVLDERIPVEPCHRQDGAVTSAPLPPRKKFLHRWRSASPGNIPACDDNATDGSDEGAAKHFSPSSRGEELRLREEILDIACQFYMDTGCLVEQALSVLREIASAVDGERIAKRRVPLFTAILSGQERAVFAFALWEAMNRIGAPRPPHDVAALCDASPRDMLRIERRHPRVGSTYCHPADYVDVICGCLQQSRATTAAVRARVERVQEELYGRRPELIVAACLYLEQVGGPGQDAQDAGQLWELCSALDLKERSLWDLIQEVDAMEFEWETTRQASEERRSLPARDGI